MNNNFHTHWFELFDLLTPFELHFAHGQVQNTFQGLHFEEIFKSLKKRDGAEPFLVASEHGHDQNYD